MSRDKCYLPDITRSKSFKTFVKKADQKIGYQISKHSIPEWWLETQGEDITIAVLDTGYTEHVDLKDSVIAGFNFHDDNDTMTDVDSHASFCTGIITANNNDIGIVGVAPKAKVLAIKVLGDEGWGYVDSVARGIEYAIEKKVDIINMSLGSEEPDELTEAAVKKAYAANIPIICASGNSGNIGALDFPARYPETISVGALNDQNIRAEFSQTGTNLDFMAPGVDILSTVPINQYAVYSGTSFSSPWIAGVVALMLSKHRTKGGTTPINNVEDVREHLKKAAIDMGPEGRDPMTGFGLIDVRKLIKNGENIMDELAAKFNEWIADQKALDGQIQNAENALSQLQNQKTAGEEKAQQILVILNS